MVQHYEPISLVKLAKRSSSQSILENIFFWPWNTISLKKGVFSYTKVNFLGVLRENIVQCQKTFFLFLLYIYTFPMASFHFFCEINDLGSKLGLQRAQFWSWLPEQQNPRNLRAWFMQLVLSCEQVLHQATERGRSTKDTISAL